MNKGLLITIGIVAIGGFALYMVFNSNNAAFSQDSGHDSTGAKSTELTGNNPGGSASSPAAIDDSDAGSSSDADDTATDNDTFSDVDSLSSADIPQ